MSRKDAKDSFTLSQYKASMEGIFTTSLTKETLDECPMVYKPMEEILANIKETVRVDKVIKSVYNFKAGEASHRPSPRHY